MENAVKKSYPTTPTEFSTWLNKAKPGDIAVYYVGGSIGLERRKNALAMCGQAMNAYKYQRGVVLFQQRTGRHVFEYQAVRLDLGLPREQGGTGTYAHL